MSKWIFEAHDSYAKLSGGTIEAASMEDAAGQLRDKGLFVLKIRQSDAPSSPPPAKPEPKVEVKVEAKAAPAPKEYPDQKMDAPEFSIENALEAHCDKVAEVRAWLQSKSKGKKQGKLIIPAIDKDVAAWIEEGLQKATVMAVYEAMRK